MKWTRQALEAHKECYRHPHTYNPGGGMCVSCVRDMEVEGNARHWATVFHMKSLGMGHANRKTHERTQERDRERKRGEKVTPRVIVHKSAKASYIRREKLLEEFPKGSMAGDYKIVGRCVVEVGGSTCVRAKKGKKPSRWVSVLTLRKHKKQ